MAMKPRMTAQEKQWQAEDAARTLINHAKVTSDPALHKRALGVINKQQAELAKAAKIAPKKIAPKMPAKKAK